MQQVMSNVSKVMIDSRGSGNLLYLPLDKLIQAAGAGAAAQAPAASALPETGGTLRPNTAGETGRTDAQGADFRSRESLRTRERGER